MVIYYYQDSTETAEIKYSITNKKWQSSFLRFREAFKRIKIAITKLRSASKV